MTEARKVAKPTVQIENERVIVTEWRFEPGAEKWTKMAFPHVCMDAGGRTTHGAVVE